MKFLRNLLASRSENGSKEKFTEKERWRREKREREREREREKERKVHCRRFSGGFQDQRRYGFTQASPSALLYFYGGESWLGGSRPWRHFTSLSFAGRWKNKDNNTESERDYGRVSLLPHQEKRFEWKRRVKRRKPKGPCCSGLSADQFLSWISSAVVYRSFEREIGIFRSILAVVRLERVFKKCRECTRYAERRLYLQKYNA